MNNIPTNDFFDEREQSLLNFVGHWHRTQKRKYTGDPYVKHLIAVARMVKSYTHDSTLVAVAICHDLYEDTNCPEKDLLDALSIAGYSRMEGKLINRLIWELTDEYIKAKYPELNRRERKKREAQRLWAVSPQAQTVKYADMIDNVGDLAQNDPGFGKRYLSEMKDILNKMDAGVANLYKQALEAAEIAEKLIKAHQKDR